MTREKIAEAVAARLEGKYSYRGYWFQVLEYDESLGRLRWAAIAGPLRSGETTIDRTFASSTEAAIKAIKIEINSEIGRREYLLQLKQRVKARRRKRK